MLLMLRFPSVLLCGGILAGCLVIAKPAEAGGILVPPKPLPKVDLTWGVKIPLRDKVELNATVYRPAGDHDPLPAIVHITPYISDNYHESAMYFAEHGYVFVQVDSRGRGNSGGIFE